VEASDVWFHNHPTQACPATNLAQQEQRAHNKGASALSSFHEPTKRIACTQYSSCRLFPEISRLCDAAAVPGITRPTPRASNLDYNHPLLPPPLQQREPPSPFYWPDSLHLDQHTERHDHRHWVGRAQRRQRRQQRQRHQRRPQRQRKRNCGAAGKDSRGAPSADSPSPCVRTIFTKACPDGKTRTLSVSQSSLTCLGRYPLTRRPRSEKGAHLGASKMGNLGAQLTHGAPAVRRTLQVTLR
jgi:hypothetical protein